MTMGSTGARTPDMMPLPPHKSAPFKFRGNHDKVKNFLKQYIRLANAYNCSDADKCEQIIYFCSRKVVKLIEALKSYQDKKWPELENDLTNYYDGARKETRYLRAHLENLVHRWKHRPIKSLTEWKKYERKFITIAGWLSSKGKINEEDTSTFFWKGINKKLRDRIESRMISAAGSTIIDITKPFKMTEVITKAESIFARNRFDVELESSEEETSDSDSDSDSQSESSTDEDYDSDQDSEDSDNEKQSKRKAKAKRRFRNNKKKHDAQNEEVKEFRKKIGRKPDVKKTKRTLTKRVEKPRDEIEELIQQMSELSIEDRDYGMIYFKALSLDPNIAKCFPAPLINLPSKSPVNPFKSGSYPTQSTSVPNSPREPITCYGCGVKGHGLSICPKISDLISAGTILRDTSGRIILKDGSYIRRMPEENFIEAINRLLGERKTGQSHYYVLQQSIEEPVPSDLECDFYGIPGADYESEVVDEEEAYVMEAERSQRKIKTARKEVLDGVYPPARMKNKGKDKEKENIQASAQKAPPIPKYPVRPGPSKTQVHPQGQPSFKPVNHNPNPVDRKPNFNKMDPIPVDVRARRFVPVKDNNSDVDMKDATKKKHQKKQPDPEVIDNKKPGFQPQPKPQRLAEVSNRLGENQVVDQILNTDVTLTVGEVLGSSKELSNQFLGMLKRKTPEKPTPVATNLLLRTRYMLIRLEMECNNNPIEAIIDTGSELNVIHKRAWQDIVKKPRNLTESLTMNDANGGEGTLEGLVSKVPLSCGSVTTYASLYVGDSVPFTLLLGRPWQRDNHINIEERLEGTYLVFQIIENGVLKRKYEVLVTPEPASPEYMRLRNKLNGPHFLGETKKTGKTHCKQHFEKESYYYNHPQVPVCGMYAIKHQTPVLKSSCPGSLTLNSEPVEIEILMPPSKFLDKDHGIFAPNMGLPKTERWKNTPLECKSISYFPEKSEILFHGCNNISPFSRINRKLQHKRSANEQGMLELEPSSAMSHPVTPQPLPFRSNDNPLPQPVQWGPPPNEVPRTFDLLVRGINDRIVYPQSNDSVFLFVSSLGRRFEPQVDEYGIPFEHGLAFNTTLIVSSPSPSVPPSVKTGQMYFKFYESPPFLTQVLAHPFNPNTATAQSQRIPTPPNSEREMTPYSDSGTPGLPKFYIYTNENVEYGPPYSPTSDPHFPEPSVCIPPPTPARILARRYEMQDRGPGLPAMGTDLGGDDMHDRPRFEPHRPFGAPDPASTNPPPASVLFSIASNAYHTDIKHERMPTPRPVHPDESNETIDSGYDNPFKLFPVIPSDIPRVSDSVYQAGNFAQNTAPILAHSNDPSRPPEFLCVPPTLSPPISSDNFSHPSHSESHPYDDLPLLYPPQPVDILPNPYVPLPQYVSPLSPTSSLASFCTTTVASTPYSPHMVPTDSPPYQPRSPLFTPVPDNPLHGQGHLGQSCFGFGTQWDIASTISDCSSIPELDSVSDISESDSNVTSLSLYKSDLRIPQEPFTQNSEQTTSSQSISPTETLKALLSDNIWDEEFNTSDTESCNEAPEYSPKYLSQIGLRNPRRPRGYHERQKAQANLPKGTLPPMPKLPGKGGGIIYVSSDYAESSCSESTCDEIPLRQDPLPEPMDFTFSSNNNQLPSMPPSTCKFIPNNPLSSQLTPEAPLPVQTFTTTEAPTAPPVTNLNKGLWDPYEDSESGKIFLAILQGARAKIILLIRRVVYLLNLPHWICFTDDIPKDDPLFHYFANECDIDGFIRTRNGKKWTTAVSPICSSLNHYFQLFASADMGSPLLTEEERTFLKKASNVFARQHSSRGSAHRLADFLASVAWCPFVLQDYQFRLADLAHEDQLIHEAFFWTKQVEKEFHWDIYDNL
jgi:hypothetical protein